MTILGPESRQNSVKGNLADYMNTFTQVPKTLASLKAANGLALRTAVRAGAGTRRNDEPGTTNHNQSR